jgi:iron complex outermembrane receptor protein
MSTLSVSLLDPRDVSPGRTTTSDLLPYKSRLTLSSLVELYAEQLLPALEIDRAALGARVHHRSSSVADPAGLIEIAAQTTFDLELGVMLADRRLALRAAVENALDASHVDILNYPLPGRRFYASAELWWW